MKEEGTPFKIVAERSREAKKVMATPKRITQVSKTASSRACNIRESEGKAVAKKIVSTARIVGKRPLQGTKLLVRIAISRSLGESIILHPVTPTALQPKPMSMVSACLPQALHLEKQQSMLKAILGR